MGKKSKKTKRKSELKVIFFIILIAAALFIVSTYAWFSTQRNVSITNLNGIVEVAEGLEISLDALNWSNGIKLGSGDTEFSITDATKTGYGPYQGHRNLSPSELLPVSTLGLVEGNMSDLKLLRGKISNTKVLDNIVEVSHDATITDSENMKFAGHFAFDIFLKNSSKTENPDILQLNYDSSVTVIEPSNATTGLQNTVRVAFALFSGTDGGGNVTGVTDVMASQETILQKTGAIAGGDDVYISDVAIWEPNSNDHAEYIVTNNNIITWATATGEMDKYQDLPNGKKGFTTQTKMPTYALKTASIGQDIADIYNWDGTTNRTTLGKQITLQTTKESETDYTINKNEGVRNLISTSSADTTDEGRTNFTIPANRVCRLRVYVWLEGQDVDCINYASHGGGVTVNIGLVKGSVEGTNGLEADGAE